MNASCRIRAISRLMKRDARGICEAPRRVIPGGTEAPNLQGSAGGSQHGLPRRRRLLLARHRIGAQLRLESRLPVLGILLVLLRGQHRPEIRLRRGPPLRPGPSHTSADLLPGRGHTLPGGLLISAESLRVVPLRSLAFFDQLRQVVPGGRKAIRRPPRRTRSKKASACSMRGNSRMPRRR
jgi:hypothetical protein